VVSLERQGSTRYGNPKRALWSGFMLMHKAGSEQAETDRYSEAPPVQMTRHPYREARERRSGEILVKVFASVP
jgi:hypothetical protein